MVKAFFEKTPFKHQKNSGFFDKVKSKNNFSPENVTRHGSVGALAQAACAIHLSGQAWADVQKMGKLTLKARQLATNVASGVHGRRLAGSGDNFWQFRPYDAGMSARRIDWRRSARGATLYIRDQEWDIAQTVFLCPDLSASMRYRSRFAHRSKEEHALLLTLSLAEMLAQAGERIAIPGLLEPTLRRDGLHHVAGALSLVKREGKSLNDFSRIARAAHVIILSDFLEDFDLIVERLRHLGKRTGQIHLVEIADPAEEKFPYQGHILFQDPENGQEFDARRAQDFAEDYKKLYLARRDGLRDLSRHYGWHFLTTLTHEPVSQALHHIYIALDMDKRSGGNRG